MDSAVSRKTKNVIVKKKKDSSKITYQKHNTINHLTKKTERIEISNLSEKAIKSVSRYENKNAFSRNTS